MKQLKLLLPVLILFQFCNKPEPDLIPVNPIPTPTTEQDTLNVLWQTPLSVDTSEGVGIHPFLHKEHIFASYQGTWSSENEVLYCFNKSNGSKIWQWEDYISNTGQSIIRHNGSHIFNNGFFINSYYDQYFVDLNSGNTIWSTQFNNGDPFISTYDDKVFHTKSFGSSPMQDSSKIVMCDIEQGNWKDIYMIQKTDEFSVNLYPPAVQINQNSDTLLVFQCKQIRTSPYEGKVHLYCYNMTQDSIVWKREEIDVEANVRPPIIFNNMVIYLGFGSVFCLNINDGNTLWKHTYNDSHRLYSSNYFIHNDNFIYRRDNGDMICVNPQTGSIVWESDKTGACCVEMRIYGDRIYYGNDELYIVNALTGEVLHKYRSPNPRASFLSAVAVDEENKRMYTTDGYFLMCMQLPE